MVKQQGGVLDNYLIICNSCKTKNRVPASSEGKSGRCGNCHTLLQPLYLRPVALSDNSFDSFLRDSPGSILAEFWSPHCPHCLEFAPVLRDAASETAGKGVIVQINIDENPRLTARFKITGVPTVILLIDGKEVKRASGTMNKQNLLALFYNR